MLLTVNNSLTAPYVKVYLVNGKKCIAKAKTSTARRTLDPLYQQQLAFREPFQGCVLQVCARNTNKHDTHLIQMYLCINIEYSNNTCVAVTRREFNTNVWLCVVCTGDSVG